MANSYTQFSEWIDDVTPEEAEWIESVLGFDPLDYEEDEDIKEFAELLGCTEERAREAECLDNWPGFEWSTRGAEKGALWLYCEEGFQESNFIFFVQEFIKKFRPDYIFTVSMAHYCDKFRIKEFGGGWMRISKDEVVCGNTWDESESLIPRPKLEHMVRVLMSWLFWDFHEERWDLEKEIGGADTIELISGLIEDGGFWPKSVEDLERLFDQIGEGK